MDINRKLNQIFNLNAEDKKTEIFSIKKFEDIKELNPYLV